MVRGWETYQNTISLQFKGHDLWELGHGKQGSGMMLGCDGCLRFGMRAASTEPVVAAVIQVDCHRDSTAGLRFVQVLCYARPTTYT